MNPTDPTRDRPTPNESTTNRPTEMRSTEMRSTEMRSTEMRSTEMRSTDNRPAANDPAENRPPKTMGEISHRNPYTGEPAGEFFNRGPIVRTDGGRSAAESERTDDGADETSAPEEDDPKDDDRSTDRMRDVDHTPPKEAADANRVFERGGREETVESEE